MRLCLVSAAAIAALLVSPAVGQNAPPDTATATPSVLAPIMPQVLPPPTPVAPQTTGQQAIPPQVPPAQTGPPPSPAPEQGTIVAVPLPPPGAVAVPAPTPAPVPAAIPRITTPAGEAATVATPTPLTPIPLALPHSATQSAAAKPGGATAKPSATPIISAKLPEPALSSEASPADFLRAARVALATGQNGAARSALEMAQTRLLDRAVDAGKENVPSHDLAVQQISEAISALTANDRMTCLRYIEFASETIGSPLD